MNNSLQIKNEVLLQMYAESLDVGTEDMGGQGKFPMVKLTAGLSKDNILANGKKSEVGKLFHTELKADFEEVEANICYVGEFELPDFKPPHELKRTYIFGAVMQSDNTPFVMYVKGMSLQKVWDFQGEMVSIKNRFKVPMFAMTVIINVTQRSSKNFGNVDVFNFTIKRNKDGSPIVETDMKRAESLQKLIPVFKDTIYKMNNADEVTDEYQRDLNGDRNYDESLDETAPLEAVQKALK